MKDLNHNWFFKNLHYDLPASLVVLLVALPLCLGIALASGAPLFSGIIAGIVGGVVVGLLSGSHTGVSGPAAGLAVVVLNSIIELGSFELFLVAVVLAGFFQIILGLLKGGIIAYYFPSSIIMGMLSGIGIIIFLKQLPHAFGDDRDTEGDFSFFQQDGENTISEIWHMFEYMSPGAIVITSVSLIILLLWESKRLKRYKIIELIPGPLVAVVSGISLNILFEGSNTLKLKANQMVNIPISDGFSGFVNNFTYPDFSALYSSQIYITAIVIAVVASLETLLCVEAADKLDKHHRSTPTNRELIAQGIGNMFSGMIGGLPVTQVIVRSSANIQSGARTKTSAISHGVLIFLSILLIPMVLNMIPLATLAAILFIVGYKLSKPTIFKVMYSQGKEQFAPFIVTVLGIIFTDLLTGLGMGLCVAIFFILQNNYKHSYRIKNIVENGRDTIIIELALELSFFNKAGMLKTLDEIPDNSNVIIDASNTSYIHYDVQEIFENFIESAEERNIELRLVELFDKREFLPVNVVQSYHSAPERPEKVKTYKKINRATLTKSDKITIVVITKFDDESIDAFRYAVDSFGIEARYVLLSIYSFENALSSGSTSPEMIRSEMLEKLTRELGAIRSVLGDSRPEIAIQFEFGNTKDVIEEGWKKNEFDLIVVPNGPQRMFGKTGKISSRQVPILVAPEPRTNLITKTSN